MATEKKKDKRGSRATQLKRNATIAGMTVEEYRKWLDKERLRQWTKKARKNPAYRAKCNERQRARQQQLIADAEFGRMARAFVGNLAGMLGEWANLRDFVVGAGEGFGKHGVARDAAQDGRGGDAASTGKEAV